MSLQSTVHHLKSLHGVTKIISPPAISLLYNVQVTTLNIDYTDIFSYIYSLTKCNSPNLNDVK